MTKKILIAVIALVLIIVAANSVYTVEENQYACTVQFSKIVATTDQAGLHFKIPFIESVKYFSKATTIYDIPPSEVYTADPQNMTVDCYILWQIEDPLTFYKTLGTTAAAEQRLDALTYNSLKNVMSTLKKDDIINLDDGAERNTIYDSIATDVDALAHAYGIRVVDVKVKQLELSDSNLASVYDNMISERNKIAAKELADGNKQAALTRNQVDKEVNILISNAQAAAAELEAEGEAEYMRILAEAYNTLEKQEFYEFMLALDALKASLTGEEKTVILDADSELARILTGKG